MIVMEADAAEFHEYMRDFDDDEDFKPFYVKEAEEVIGEELAADIFFGSVTFDQYIYVLFALVAFMKIIRRDSDEVKQSV